MRIQWKDCIISDVFLLQSGLSKLKAITIVSTLYTCFNAPPLSITFVELASDNRIREALKSFASSRPLFSDDPITQIAEGQLPGSVENSAISSLKERTRWKRKQHSMHIYGLKVTWSHSHFPVARQTNPKLYVSGSSKLLLAVIATSRMYIFRPYHDKELNHYVNW